MRIPLGVLVTGAILVLPVDSLDARSDARSGGASNARSGGVSDRRSGGASDARSDARSGGASNARSREASNSRSGAGGAKGVGREACRRRGDLRVPLKYLHGGSVWIPAEARCGGRYPVVVLLHGNNTARETVKSIGGGRNLDAWVRRYLNGKLIEPLVLAEPIHFGACANDERRAGLPYLFTGAFDFREYRRRLEATLRRHGVRASSWSFIGHSGAACCLTMGMFAVKEVWPEIKVWGSADGCYSEKAQAVAIGKQFEGSNTRVFNACRGYPAYQGYLGYERALLTRDRVAVKCDSTYYKQCRRHPTRPWFSFTTHFTGPEKHSKVLEELFKTIVFHEFPSERRVAYKRAQAARRAKLAAARRPGKRPRVAVGGEAASASHPESTGRKTRASSASQGGGRKAGARTGPRAGTLASREE